MSLRSTNGISTSVLQLLEEVLPHTQPGVERDVFARTLMAALKATPVRLHKAFPNFSDCRTSVGRFPDFYSFLYNLRASFRGDASAVAKR